MRAPEEDLVPLIGVDVAIKFSQKGRHKQKRPPGGSVNPAGGLRIRFRSTSDGARYKDGNNKVSYRKDRLKAGEL